MAMMHILCPVLQMQRQAAMHRPHKDILDKSSCMWMSVNYVILMLAQSCRTSHTSHADTLSPICVLFLRSKRSFVPITPQSHITRQRSCISVIDMIAPMMATLCHGS